MKLTILIGCFNERATIERAIAQAKEITLDKEILVIDNCSTDGTREILQGMKNDTQLEIILHSKNMGAGYSGSEGLGLARGEYFYAPGADLEYRMDDVYKMIEVMEKEKVDLVLGSRLLARTGVSLFQLVKERPYWLGTIIATFLMNVFYGKKFVDIIGSSLFKTKILKSLDCKATGQALVFEIISKHCKRGYRIQEVPVSYKPRTHKEGKTIRAIDMVPAVWAMVKIKIFG